MSDERAGEPQPEQQESAPDRPASRPVRRVVGAARPQSPNDSRLPENAAAERMERVTGNGNDRPASPEQPGSDPVPSTDQTVVSTERPEADRLQPGFRIIEASESERVQGKVSHAPYIRRMTIRPVEPSNTGVLKEDRAGFRRSEGGVLVAENAAAEPQGGVAAVYGRFKNVLVGGKLASSQLSHQRLSKLKALAVFSSDALSSSAYATEEILIILALAGTGYLDISIPIAIAIAALLWLVIISYRQVIRAYPNGGGAYIVARENLGDLAGQVAAAALLVDYALTVSVSIAAGVAAITSALPELYEYRILIGVAAIFIITILNLRGISESATIFAYPTYAFVAMALGLLLVGAVRAATGNLPQVEIEHAAEAAQGLTLFLILRAFSSGCAALTGVEAISNGVPAFKAPEARNAGITMLWMGAILGTVFVGFTLLAHQVHAIPTHDETVVSQLGRTVFGHNAAYYVWQVATALILLLAANTAYSGFPQLGSLLAKDDYLPHQFSFRGDRLAYSNGIMILAVGAALILAIGRGLVNNLIALYAVGVFVTFTLAQVGMLVFWRRSHPQVQPDGSTVYGRLPGWRQGLIINGVSGVATLGVAVIIVVTKFLAGAWATIAIMVVLVLMFQAIHRHYKDVARRLALPDDEPPITAERRQQVVLVPVRDLNQASVRALRYARSISNNVTALHVTDDLLSAEKLRIEWERRAAGIQLMIIESPFRSFTQPVLSYIDAIDDGNPETLLTVVLPEFVPRHWWQTILHGQDALRLKGALLFREGTVVIDVPTHGETGAASRAAT